MLSVGLRGMRMEIDNHKVIDATAETTFGLLMDPAVLVEAMPGLKRMTPEGDNIFHVEMELGIPGFKGKYAGTMQIDQIKAPVFYHLHLSGNGPAGTIEMDLRITLTASGNGQQTDLHYEGEGQFGSPSSGVAQKVLSGASSVILGQFFSEISKRAHKIDG
ncbi:carbon monoxide dehydrogenase [Sulfobacillus sp. hq2]|nr:carbon monoxide dehydrogenase [Sulfobacillus sp. hq2]